MHSRNPFVVPPSGGPAARLSTRIGSRRRLHTTSRLTPPEDFTVQSLAATFDKLLQKIGINSDASAQFDCSRQHTLTDEFISARFRDSQSDCSVVDPLE